MELPEFAEANKLSAQDLNPRNGVSSVLIVTVMVIVVVAVIAMDIGAAAAAAAAVLRIFIFIRNIDVRTR